MPASVKNILIEQGATFTLTLSIKSKSTGQPVDISGHTARMQVRPTVASSTVLVSATTENGKITVTGSTGTIAVTLSATETAALDFGSAVYDLESVSGATVKRRLQGVVTLSKEVTR